MEANRSRESVSEILKDGIKAEVLANQFYSKGQRSTADAELVALFASLAQDEASHEHKLRSLYLALVGAEAPEQVIDVSREVATPITSDPLSVLRMAMEREQRARSYYRFLAAQVDGQEAKDLLLVLESEEEHHFDLLEMELKGRLGLPWSQPELDNWVRDD